MRVLSVKVSVFVGLLSACRHQAIVRVKSVGGRVAFGYYSAPIY